MTHLKGQIASLQNDQLTASNSIRAIKEELVDIGKEKDKLANICRDKEDELSKVSELLDLSIKNDSESAVIIEKLKMEIANKDDQLVVMVERTEQFKLVEAEKYEESHQHVGRLNMDNDNLRCGLAQKEKEHGVLKQDNDSLASELRKARGEIDILLKTNEVDIKNLNAKWEEEIQRSQVNLTGGLRNVEEQLKVKNAVI